MKRKRKIIIAVCIGLIAAISVGMFALSRGLSYMADIEPSGISLDYIRDGRYTGTFEHGRFTNTITIQIQGNRIVEIIIDNDVWAGGVLDISDEVFGRVIDAQDTKIDAIAGSTITTTAYLKAIENALAEGE